MSLKVIKGECPICGSTSGKCREHIDKPDHYLCMGFADARKGDVVSGYRCTGHAKGGLWATFALDNYQEYSKEQWDKWANDKQQRQAKHKAIEDHIREKSLSLESRDSQYKALLAELTLTNEDKADLKSRGFSDQEIALCGYKSVSKYQQLQKRYTHLLPGVASCGKKLINFDEGYLLPVRNGDGLIVACQIRIRTVTDGGRYRWLTSKTKTNEKGQSPHIHSKGFSELPLAIHYPEGKPEGIALVEGVGIKPFLASRRLNLAVIGASGGQWCSSPNVFKNELDNLASKAGTKEVLIFPDAGDIANSAVMHRWKELVSLLEEWGYTVKFGWWGQETKLDPDIDELTQSQYSDIEYLYSQPFFEIGKRKNGFDWTKDWLDFRQFTPNIQVHQPEFSFPNIPESSAIIAVHSGLGTNKTGALIDMIKSSGRRAILIGYRNNLLLQTIARAKLKDVKIYHLQMDDAGHLVSDNDTLLALCLDSIAHVDGYFTDVDIYIDEACSVILHACNGGTLDKNQGRAIAILNKALQVCNRVFMLDGNLNNPVVNFVSKLCPDKQVVKIKNTFKIPPHKFIFVNSIDPEGELKKKDRSPVVKSFLAEGVIPFIASDSKEFTKTLYELLVRLGKRGYVLNAETVAEPWAKDFLDNPDSFIQDNKPDFFIISPTAESGISITIKNYFTDKFTFFVGVLGTNSQHQMLFRLRDNTIPHYVFCPERSLIDDRNTPRTYIDYKHREMTKASVAQSAILAANGVEDINKIIFAGISRSDENWWVFSSQLGVIDNREMDHLRKCLIYALEEVGHEVIIENQELDEDVRELLKDAREAVIQQHALELEKADPYESLEKANEIAKGNPRKQVQRRIEITRYLDRLPGIKELDVWGQDFIADYLLKDRHFLRKQQAFYMLNNFEISRKRSEVNWYYQATNQHYFIGQFKGDSHLKIWALQELKLLQFLDGEYHKESLEVLELMAKVRSDEKVALALGCDIPKETVDKRENIKFVGQLLAMIGLSFGKARKELINGVSTRFYSINEKILNNPARFAMLECLARKFENYLNSETVSKVNWENTITQAVEPKQLETPTQPEVIEPEAPTHLLMDKAEISSHMEVFTTPESAPATVQNYSLRRVSFEINDLVNYVGNQFVELKEFPLVVVDISNSYVTCKKQDGYFTTWLHTEELSHCNCLVTAA